MAKHRFPSESRYQRDQWTAVIGAVMLVVVVTVMSVWGQHRSASAQPDSLDRTATPPPSALAPQAWAQLRAWLTNSEPSINAVVIARNNIAAAAAERDIAGTGAACQTATGAIADLHRQLPSPEPTLTNALQQVISDYDVALPSCIAAVHVQGQDMQLAAAFITRADGAMQSALDFLNHVPGCEPSYVGVVIV